MSSGKLLPLHVIDPFNLSESLTVGAVTVFFVFSLHYFLGSFSSSSSLASVNNKKTKNFRFFQLNNNTNNNNKNNSDAAIEEIFINEEYRARIISFLHALFSTIGSAHALYQNLVVHNNNGQNVWFDTREATRSEANWQMFSFAYFACDTIMMLLPFVKNYFSPSTASKQSEKEKLLIEKRNKETTTFFIHHLIALASLSCGSFLGIYGPIVCAAQLAGEISNPFMHLRWLMNADGRRDHFVCKHICTKMWYLTFFVSRLIISPYLSIFAVRVMHPVFWPQVWLMIIFSGKFIYDAWKSDKKGEWWTG
jgi:hypothetical protein